MAKIGEGWKVEVHRGCKVFRFARFHLTKYFDSDVVELTIRPPWSTSVQDGGETSFIPSEVIEYLLNLKGTKWDSEAVSEIGSELQNFKAKVEKLSAEFSATTEKMKMTKDDLGKTYKDRATGFRGPATAICFDISGQIQVRLEPATSEPRWFDAARLEEIVRDTSRDLTNPGA